MFAELVIILRLYSCFLFATDNDECITNNSNCDHVCSNTIGSFNCSCDSGFSLHSNGATCHG